MLSHYGGYRKGTLRQQLSLSRQYLKSQWASVAAMIFFVLLNVGMELAAPLELARFIDQAEGGASLADLQTTALIFMALTIGRQVIVAGASYLGEGISLVATNRLRADLVGHCLELDMAFHKSRTPGELIERVEGDVTTLAQFFSSMFFDVLGRVLLCVGIVVLMLVIQWRIGLLFVALALIDMLLLRRMRGIAVPHFRELRQVRAELSGFFEEHLTSLEDIKGVGAGHHTMHKLHRVLQRFLRLNRKSAVTSRYFSSSLELSISAASAGVLALGAVLIEHHTVLLGTVYMSFYYTQLLSLTILRISRNLNQFQAASASIQRISELYYTTSSITDPDTVEPLPAGALSVQFQNVSFRYEAAQLTLDGISFRLSPGETVGLIGRTGSGKTTISRLILRSYDACGGLVCVGGVDVRRARLSELRSRIGVVTQDVQLFRASLRDNLTLFDRSVSMERITDVIESLGLTAWYQTLPDGLDSFINSSDELSAGEAQLLGFIRILLREPDIVILDEASSRLDPATERLVEQAVAKLLTGRTGIVIAHRLSTVGRLDKIILMENGRIDEMGHRAELLRDSSSQFSALLAGDPA